MKKLFVLLLTGLSTITYALDSTPNAYTLDLSTDSIIMQTRIEQKTVGGRTYPSLNSSEVIFQNFRQTYTLSVEDVETIIDAPVDNNIGSRFIIALSKSNGRLIFYAGQELGNIGANLGSINFSEQTGTISFSQKNTEKALKKIYSKAMFESLKEKYKLYNLDLCVDAETNSGLICSPKSIENQYECKIERFNFKLTTDC